MSVDLNKEKAELAQHLQLITQLHDFLKSPSDHVKIKIEDKQLIESLTLSAMSTGRYREYELEWWNYHLNTMTWTDQVEFTGWHIVGYGDISAPDTLVLNNLPIEFYRSFVKVLKTQVKQQAYQEVFEKMQAKQEKKIKKKMVKLIKDKVGKKLFKIDEI